MLLRLPPLVLGLFGGLGFVGGWIGPDTSTASSCGDPGVCLPLPHRVQHHRAAPADHRRRAPRRPRRAHLGRVHPVAVVGVAGPQRLRRHRLDHVRAEGRPRHRAHAGLRLLLYTARHPRPAIVVLPLVLLGPGLSASWLPDARRPSPRRSTGRRSSSSACCCSPRCTTCRRRDGARGGATCPAPCSPWRSGSAPPTSSRISLEASLGGSSIYGPLSTPIVLLIWLYALAIAILIGAGLNAATRTLWPVDLHEGATSLQLGGSWHRARPSGRVDAQAGPTRATSWRRRRGDGRGRATTCGATTRSASGRSERRGAMAWPSSGAAGATLRRRHQASDAGARRGAGPAASRFCIVADRSANVYQAPSGEVTPLVFPRT